MSWDDTVMAGQRVVTIAIAIFFVGVFAAYVLATYHREADPGYPKVSTPPATSVTVGP